MVTVEEARNLLALHGEVRAQPPTDWIGPFATPPAVDRFYREVGPANITIGACGNPYFLPSLADLWSFQAGYRWNALNGEPIEDWSDDWIVIADEGGDPFILERSSSVVLHAFHGEGAWDPVTMFPNLNTMAVSLGLLGAIVRDAGDSFLDEDCCVRPTYVATALVQFQELLGSRLAGTSALARLGWT
jgi:hypothetical protein